MTKKHEKTKTEAPVLGTGGFGDLDHPEAGAPIEHEEGPGPVETPAEKEHAK